MKYAFIQQHNKEFRVSLMCSVLGVPRSGYYEWQQRPENPHSAADKRVSRKITTVFEKNRKTYGTRRIKLDLAEIGEIVSRPRISRLMKEQGLRCKSKRKFKATTNSKHNRPVALNHLDRQFQVSCPDTVYVNDINYIPTGEGWLDLAVVIDLFSRSVVGWSMSSRINAQLVDDALHMAIAKRKPSAGLLLHSDRGSRYASELYQGSIKKSGFTCSMSRKGNCWDNAPDESFFHTLKTELTHHKRYNTRAEAKSNIFEYIEVFYNRRRRHSAIGYLSPAAYEAAYQKTA